jgi:hypothetical protein
MSSRLSLHDGSIQLLSDNISKNQAKHYTSLPGANGPNPKSSTGAKHLSIMSPPSFIEMSGKPIVHLENGSWEGLFGTTMLHQVEVSFVGFI